MKIRFMKMFLLAMFGLTPCLTGSSLDEVEKQLAEIANHEEVLQASKILTKIVFGSDKDAISALNSENKIRAIDLIGRYKIVECLPVLIDTIERIAPVYDRYCSLGYSVSLYRCNSEYWRAISSLSQAGYWQGGRRAALAIDELCPNEDQIQTRSPGLSG